SRMQRMLRRIQDEYEYPVDTEFTINVSDDGEYSIDLLQCRPLQVISDRAGITVPSDIPKENILLESRGASMGLSKASKLDIIVYVDPVAYYNMPYREKASVAKMIGRINWHYRNMGKHMMLMVPGRVGTSSPELGVPTSFAEISEFDVVCEMEESRAGYNPELSYGSHFFQDLVEAEILYTAVFNNEKTLHFAPEKLRELKSILGEIDEESGLEEIVAVYDVSGCGCRLFNDIKNEHLLITI
ncbi:MAG: phosphoenolpyruvate synthase, partial [Clostridia bacterium]|nr:phosphoenolpyruvate synthase [Clostridia bacterium]